MDGVFNIFQGITGSRFFEVYLNVLDEHQSLSEQSYSGENVVVQAISSLLAKCGSRLLGLQLLNKYLDQCTSETLERKANLWISFVLKSCNSNELLQHAALKFEVIAKFAEMVVQSSDLRKTFATNHLPKVYEALIHVPEDEGAQFMALYCIEVCLRNYPGPSGPSKGLVEHFLACFIDIENECISSRCGKCHLLLLQVRGGSTHGLSQKGMWQNYQLQLLENMHALLNIKFAKCVEVYDSQSETVPLHLPILDLSNEPADRAAQLVIRFCNLAIYLIAALREPFPVEKPIMPKKVLNLVRRGLSVTLLNLQSSAVMDNIALGILLPKVHYHLLDVLQTIIQTMGSHLKILCKDILDLLTEALKGTVLKATPGPRKPLAKLRMKVYEVLSVWCRIVRSGSCCENIAEFFIQEILEDISPFQSGCVLKVLAGARKQLTKKARRQLHKAVNEQTNIVQKYANDNSFGSHSVSEESNRALCVGALRCLQDLMLSSTSYLKPTILKEIEKKLMQVSTLFYQLTLEPKHLYYDHTCRLEMFNTLYILVMTPHHFCPPPMQLVLSLIKTGYESDNNWKVRSRCFEILTIVEKLVHPQKEGLLFCVDERRIRNTFIELGKENLLNSSYLSNLSSENNSCADVFCKSSSNVICDEDSDTNSDLKAGVHTEFEASIDENVENVEKQINYEDSTNKQTTNEESIQSLSQFATIKESSIVAISSEQQKMKQCDRDGDADSVSLERTNLEFINLQTDEDVIMVDIEACFVNELN